MHFGVFGMSTCLDWSGSFRQEMSYSGLLLLVYHISVLLEAANGGLRGGISRRSIEFLDEDV